MGIRQQNNPKQNTQGQLLRDLPFGQNQQTFTEPPPATGSQATASYTASMMPVTHLLAGTPVPPLDERSLRALPPHLCINRPYNIEFTKSIPYYQQFIAQALSINLISEDEIEPIFEHDIGSPQQKVRVDSLVDTIIDRVNCQIDASPSSVISLFKCYDYDSSQDDGSWVQSFDVNTTRFDEEDALIDDTHGLTLHQSHCGVCALGLDVFAEPENLHLFYFSVIHFLAQHSRHSTPFDYLIDEDISFFVLGEECGVEPEEIDKIALYYDTHDDIFMAFKTCLNDFQESYYEESDLVEKLNTLKYKQRIRRIRDSLVTLSGETIDDFRIALARQNNAPQWLVDLVGVLAGILSEKIPTFDTVVHSHLNPNLLSPISFCHDTDDSLMNTLHLMTMEGEESISTFTRLNNNTISALRYTSIFENLLLLIEKQLLSHHRGENVHTPL